MTSSTAQLTERHAAHYGLSRREKVFTLLGTLLGLLLAALDQTIVATAGPAIQRDLHVAPAVYPWLTTAYLVASTVMVPIYGKLSDLFGRKRILLVGIGLFLLGSLACGMSRTTPLLLASRALQGTGSAALFTSAFAVVADIFPPAERGKYQGIFGGCFALSSVAGPLLGGFLTDALSWHWVFFVNLPLGAIAVAFIVFRMPPLHTPREGPLRIDFAGAFWLLSTVVPFLLALSLDAGSLHAPWTRPALLAVAVVSLLAFLRAEKRAADPLLDLRLFRNRVFALGNLSAFILGCVFLGSIVFLPLFMVNVVGLSATNAGLTLTPLTFGVVAGNVISGQLVARLGKYKALMLLSIVVLMVGFCLLGFTLTPDSTQREVTLKMIVIGLGMGPTIPLYTLAIQNAVSTRDVGVATAAATFFRQIGATVGLALLGVVFATALSRELSAVPRPEDLPEPAAPALAAAEGETQELHVDVPALSRAIAERYADAPLERERALVALRRYDADTRAAFTTAISGIYRWALLFAVLGLCATLAIPELPLGRGSDAKRG